MIQFELPEQHPIDPKRRYLCRHVFSEGRRCGSPALRGQHLCFYHHSARQQPAAASGHAAVFTMPAIDDRAGIQLAIYSIMARIAAAEIDSKRAGLLLYGLQIASANLPRRAATVPADATAQPEPLVEQISHHTEYGLLAPVQELPEAPQQHTDAEQTQPSAQPPSPTEPTQTPAISTQPTHNALISTEPTETLAISTEPTQTLVISTEPIRKAVISPEPTHKLVISTEGEAAVERPPHSPLPLPWPAQTFTQVPTTEPTQKLIISTEDEHEAEAESPPHWPLSLPQSAA